MIRELAKSAVCHALAFARLETWLEERRAIVVGYHQVVEHETSEVMPGLAISAQMLAEHLDWIGRRCKLVSLDQLAATLEHGRPARPVCAVTFDDGYAGVHHHALPLLRAKGIPAAVFVVPGAAGEPLRHDRLYRALVARGDVGAYESARHLIARFSTDELDHLLSWLEPPGSRSNHDARALTWNEIVTLHAAGITIGSHTSSHARLVGLSDERLADEVAGSRRALEQRLGAPVDHFAYPDGQFDRDVVAAVAAAGYRYGYTVCHHRDPQHPLLTIPRTMLWERSSLGAAGRFSGAVLGCQLHGELPFLDGCEREHARG